MKSQSIGEGILSLYPSVRGNNRQTTPTSYIILHISNPLPYLLVRFVAPSLHLFIFNNFITSFAHCQMHHLGCLLMFYVRLHLKGLEPIMDSLEATN